jgi:putative zinc finger protein
VTHASQHVDDEILSALVDEQLSPSESAAAQEHLASCADCSERLDGFRSVAVLVRRLPAVEPPRDFAIGPGLLIDPPNVVRLRRWYTAARAAAASLAAVFVLLSAGTLYIDSRPATSAPAAAVAKPQVLLAPGDANVSPAAPAAAQRAAVPQASPAAPALVPASGAAPRSAAPPQADDQVAATTSVRPLPTQPPTPLPTAAPVSAPVAIQTTSVTDPAAPVRISAIVVGLLAALSLLATLVVRHRLQQQTPTS